MKILIFQFFLIIDFGVELTVAERGQLFDPGIIWTEHDRYHNESRVQCQPADVSKLAGIPDVKGVMGVITISKPSEMDQYFHVAMYQRNKTLVLFNKPRKSIMAREYMELGKAVGYPLGQPIEWTVFANTSENVNGLSLDENTGNIYWTDSAYDAIFVSRVQIDANSDAMVLIDYDLDEPYGIATFAQKGLLFWTDSGVDPKIESSTLAGRNRKLILNRHVGIPRAISIDTSAERLYWIDMFTLIRSCDLNGNDIKSIKQLNGEYWSDIVIFKSVLVGARPKPAGIVLLNSTTGETLLSKELSSNPFGLAIYETANNRQDQCENSDCPELCVSGMNNSADCYCRQKYTFIGNTSSLTCVQCETYGSVLLATDKGLYSVWRNVVEFDFVEVNPVYVGQNYSTMAVDSVNDQVFIFEQVAKVIKVIDLRLQSEKTIITSVGFVQGIAVDWISRHIYWTDSENLRIMVSNYDGSYPILLIPDISSPSAIAVHPELRVLFWSNPTLEIVETSALDGSRRRRLMIEFAEVTSITIDYKKDMLYMFDGKTNVIQSFDINGQRQRFVVKIPDISVRSMAILNDYVIWSFEHENSFGLMFVDKTTEEKLMFVNKTIRGDGHHEIYLNNTVVNGLAFHHYHTSPDPSGPCFDQNKCDHLCFPVFDETGYCCECMFGYYLDDDDKCKPGTNCAPLITNPFLYFHEKCFMDKPVKNKHLDQIECLTEPQVEVEHNKYLIVVDQSAPAIFQYDLHSGKFTVIPVQGLRQPYAVAFDSDIRKQVYWTDLSLHTISRASLDGFCQEVIYADETTWFMDVVIDKYTKKILSADYSNDRIVAISVTDLSYTYIQRTTRQWLPMGLTIDDQSRKLIIASRGRFPRLSSVNISGSNYTTFIPWPLEPRAVAVKNNIVYWIERNGEINSIVRSNSDGSNYSTVLHSPSFHPRDIAVGLKYIYWTDYTSGTIWRVDLETELHMTMLGERHQLYKPAGIFLVDNDFEFGTVKRDQRFGKCHGVRRVRPNIPYITVSTQSLCIVPSIEYGYVEDNIPGAYVSSGVEITITCFEAFQLSETEAIICENGNWSMLPRCVTEFEIYGDNVKGWTAFLSSGKFYVFNTMQHMRVYCIGGGGGGYDSENALFRNRSSAGDGGDSSVTTMDGHRSVCYAEGGKGGGLINGGTGGYGTEENGESGGDAGSCNGGGSGCSGYNPYLCGAGGPILNCSTATVNETYDEGNFNSSAKDEENFNGGLFGGGAGSFRGGSGGGGGYASIIYSHYFGNLLNVKVGTGGEPSFGKAGQGIVVITWGMDEHELYSNISKLRQYT